MKTGWLVAGTLAFGLLAGCERTDSPQVRQQVQGIRQEVGNAAESARRAADNAGLAAKVKAALTTRKGLEGAKIDVDAKEGVIVLKGDVKSPEQAKLAEQAASETQGVNSVQNQLTMRIPATTGITGTTPGPLGP